MSPVVVFIVAVIFVGALVFLMISKTGAHEHAFDKEEYQTDFLAIENQLSKDHPLSFNASVVEADKLLDKALMELGLPGNTMGERLKAAAPKFSDRSDLNSVWYVHKMRNSIAHEPGYTIDYNQARRAMQTYRKALRILGAI